MGIAVKEYELPILEALLARGGALPTKQVPGLVEEKMHERFNPHDLASIRDRLAERICMTRVRVCRVRMIRRGWLSAAAERGIWDITEQGRAHLSRVQDEP